MIALRRQALFKIVATHLNLFFQSPVFIILHGLTCLSVAIFSRSLATLIFRNPGFGPADFFDREIAEDGGAVIWPDSDYSTGYFSENPFAFTEKAS